MPLYQTLFIFGWILLTAIGNLWGQSQIQQTEGSKGAAFPFLSRIAGIGLFYGGAAGLVSDDRGANFLAGTTFGEVQVHGLFLSLPLGESVDFGLAYGQLRELNMDTNYHRGMASESTEDIVRMRAEGSGGIVFLNFLFFDGILKWNNSLLSSNFEIQDFKDDEGEKIELPDNGLTPTTSQIFSTGFVLRFLDDYTFPRKGIQLDLSQSSTQQNGGLSDTIIYNYGAKLYLPLGDFSTWVFYFSGSDAHVTKEKHPDPDDVRSILHVQCGQLTDPDKQAQCQRLEDDLVEYIVANNTQGTASPLGGARKLRSYREARFRGKFVRFAGTEVRFNVSSEISGTQNLLNNEGLSALQLSLFIEAGSANDEGEKIGTNERTSYGGGIRLVMNQLVLRLDSGWGEEGGEWNLTIGQPW